MKNKRAFTLTEIIAVVVIIGLLVAIVIPAVSSYVKSGKERVNKSNATTLEIAARDYFDKNKIELPEPGQAISVLGSFLRDNSILVNDLKDADGGNCDNSYVVVSNNEGDYDYHACMKCDNYNTANGDELCETYDPSSDDESSGGDIGDENLNCDFIFNKKINSEFNAADLEATVRVNSKNKIKSITVNNTKVSFNQNKNNNMYEGLASYKFNKTNRYLVKATVTDIKGRTVTCSNKYIDSITDPFPTIETINVDNDKPTIEVGASSEAWANKDKEAIIPITITDTGSGINLDSFTLDNIKIKQYVINESDPSLISKRTLTIPNETVLEYDEENSVTNKATKTYKYNLKIKGIETSGKIELEVGPVSDKVGNQSPIIDFSTNTIKLTIDNVKPTCKLIKNDTNYGYSIYAISNDTYEASAECSDTYGVCTNKTKKLIESFTEEGKYTPDFKVRDKAGNVTVCPKYNVIIDKTAPTCRISTTDDGVYANYKKLSLTVEDNLTYVSSSLEGTYYNPSTNTDESWSNNHINPAIITSYNPEESSTIEMFNISKNGTYKVNIVDDAGNTSYCQLPVTYVDNVAPTIELTNLNLDTIESITEDGKQVKVGQIKANITDISGIRNINYTYTMEGYTTDLGIGEMTKKSDGYYYSNSIKYPGLHTITVKDNSKIYPSVNDIGTSNYTTGNTATATTNSYMIDFNLTGGTVSTPTSMIKMKGVNRTLAAPSQSGYTFDGWYENSYGSGTKYSSPFYLERNRDLYGKLTICAAGTYENNGVCQQCPAGYYCSGGSSINECTSGKYSTGGASSCSTCPAGKYNTGNKNTGCTTCPAGYYCTGGSSINECTSGKYSTGGASSCSTCPAGKYNTGNKNTGCTTCPAGYYCTGGSHIATCPSGQTSPAGSTSSSACYSTKGVCDYTSEELFGTGRGNPSGNSGDWVNSQSTWGSKWCKGQCNPSGGYKRICATSNCTTLGINGMTAADINSTYGCDFAKYWCTC